MAPTTHGIDADGCGWALFQTTQRAAWDEIREEAHWTLRDGHGYRYATADGAVTTVTTLAELAAVTRHERAWLGRWWPEDSGRGARHGSA